jgi:hypothetical protein
MIKKIWLATAKNTILLLNFGFGYYSICLVKLRELGASKRSLSLAREAITHHFLIWLGYFSKYVWIEKIYILYIYFF